MYFCQNCHKEFDFAKVYFEKHLEKENTYERFLLCPFCNSTSFYEKKGTYCKYCGSRLRLPGRDYCSESCRKRGEAMFEKEKMKKLNRKSDEITSALLEVDTYNKNNGCRLSYGQYFALKGVGRI